MARSRSRSLARHRAPPSVSRGYRGFSSVMLSWMPWLSKIFNLKTRRFSVENEMEKTLKNLERQVKNLRKKVSQEVQKAEEYARVKDERAAIRCWEMKKKYKEEIERLGNFQLMINDLIIMLEGANATIETVGALRIGLAELDTKQMENYIHGMCNAVDDINEQHKILEQIQEVVPAPRGAAAVFDEGEHEAKVEEPEGIELGEQRLPAATASAAPEQVIGGPLPAPLVPQGSD